MGALMEKALMYQQHRQVAEAGTTYRQVLAFAPNTHDALHMLGVIEFEFRNFDSAMQLIEAAIKLRPAYAAVETNLALVRAASQERARASDEQLAECALPALYDLVNDRTGRPAAIVRSRSESSQLHLVGRLASAIDDDAWILLRLSEILAPRAPNVWAVEEDVRGAVPHAVSFRSIDYSAGNFPRGGTQVFIGLNFELGDWIRQSRPDRLVVVCTRARPTVLIDQLRTLAQHGQRQLELVFLSPTRSSRFGLGHSTIPIPVESSLIGSGRESPGPDRAQTHETADHAWRCGMIGQDSDQVVDPDDAQVLSDVAAKSGTLVLYDPARYRFHLGASAAIEFIDRSECSLPEFLSRVDCLYCRPVHWWNEGVGREVVTALALGKIVICPRSSTWAHLIDDGVDGFLYESHEQSLAILDSIRGNAGRSAVIASAARTKARELVDVAQNAASYAVISDLKRTDRDVQASA